MRENVLDQYTNDEFALVVSESYSFADLCRKLGYNCQSGGTLKRVKRRVDYLNLSTEHFRCKKTKTQTYNDVFVKNSTVSQSTLRRWYRKGKDVEYVCVICGQMPFWNGKEMSLILDHIDGDNHNNQLDNLRWVCPNCNRQLETTNRKKEKKINRCIDCGKVISLVSTRCIPCSKLCKKEIANQTLPPLQRYELKELIRKLPFTIIAKQYNVSDNAIRKWCKKYNLPTKSSEIKRINDKDWEFV